MLNETKSILIPTQELEFLSFLVISIKMSLYLPRDKLKSIRRECQTMINNPSVSIRTLSRLLGKLSAFDLANTFAEFFENKVQSLRKNMLDLS